RVLAIVDEGPSGLTPRARTAAREQRHSSRDAGGQQSPPGDRPLGGVLVHPRADLTDRRPGRPPRGCPSAAWTDALPARGSPAPAVANTTAIAAMRAMHPMDRLPVAGAERRHPVIEIFPPPERERKRSPPAARASWSGGLDRAGR